MNRDGRFDGINAKRKQDAANKRARAEIKRCLLSDIDAAQDLDQIKDVLRKIVHVLMGRT